MASSRQSKRTAYKRRTTIAKPPNTTSAYSLLIQHRKMQDKREQIQIIGVELEELRKRSREIMKQRERALTAQAHLMQLRALVTKQTALLQEERKVIEKRKETLLSSCGVIQQSVPFISYKKVLDAIDAYHADRRHLQTFDRKLRLRQHKMCRQLLHIFPFRRVRTAPIVNQSLQTAGYEIRTMSLPSGIDELLSVANSGGQGEEKMALGLGYIAHLCTLLSRYLQIPLRHSIICKGSRSEIIDAFAEANAFALMQRNQKSKSPNFPLYSKGTDRKLFKKGVELLQEDVSQLCISLQMVDELFDEKAFIHNVRTILYTQALARF